MKLEIILNYDVVISSHRNEVKEIEFSVEDFEKYLTESYITPYSEEDLEWIISDYLSDKDLDRPDTKDNEDVDWDTFEIEASSINNIFSYVKHLIKE